MSSDPSDPEPSPQRVAALRYLDRAVAAIHADFLARQQAAASAALPGGESGHYPSLSLPAGGHASAGLSLPISAGRSSD